MFATTLLFILYTCYQDRRMKGVVPAGGKSILDMETYHGRCCTRSKLYGAYTCGPKYLGSWRPGWCVCCNVYYEFGGDQGPRVLEVTLLSQEEHWRW